MQVIPQQQQLPRSPSGFQGLPNFNRYVQLNSQPRAALGNANLTPADAPDARRPFHGNVTTPGQPVHHPAALQHQSYQQPLVDDLASYVDHVASARAQSALELHRSTWQEKQQLDALVKQQSARLQQQAAELEVLRGLARQQQPAQTVQQQPQLQQQGAGFSSTQDSRLQRLMDLHKQVGCTLLLCPEQQDGFATDDVAASPGVVPLPQPSSAADATAAWVKRPPQCDTRVRVLWCGHSRQQQLLLQVGFSACGTCICLA